MVCARSFRKKSLLVAMKRLKLNWPLFRVIDVFETVRHLTPQGSETVNRDDYKLVQTPQVFEVGLLKNAYSQAYSTHFTDDASVVESAWCIHYACRRKS